MISALTLAVMLAGPGAAAPQAATLPIEEVSPLFLGIYRKVLEIEGDIQRYSQQYGVDFDLARAVCLYESGGNAELNSGAGARGYFQVMPGTFRSLRVTSNIEAGVKYLSQMIRQFEREDRAIAAYNAGPGRVGRGGGLPLETVQYVLGVGQYRTVLKLYDASLRELAKGIELTDVRAGEDWASLAARLDVPEWELRLHNPFLAQRRLRVGQRIAHPTEPRTDLFRVVGEAVEYRMRYGDNYLKLALTLGVDLTALRSANGLWHVQSLPPGAPLRIPLAADREGILRAALGQAPLNAPERPALVRTALVAAPPVITAAAPRSSQQPSTVLHRVSRGDTLSRLAVRYGTTIRVLQRVNGLSGRTTIRLGQVLRVPDSTERPLAEPALRGPQRSEHRVRRGDTLDALARQYGSTAAAIQRANGMGTRTTIRTGERLQIPERPSGL